MKSLLLKSALLAVAGLALCAPVALHAQTTAPAPAPVAVAPSKPAKVTKTPYKGTIKSIDAASLVVTTAKGDLTLALAPTTKVKVDKKAAKATDLTVGEKVTGSYTTDATGALTAYSVHGKTK
jgi:hypothetical protein